MSTHTQPRRRGECNTCGNYVSFDLKRCLYGPHRGKRSPALSARKAVALGIWLANTKQAVQS